MGHNVGTAAENAVKKSAKVEEKKSRTEEQVIKDIENHLDAHLAIPPNDVRLLLKKYKEARVIIDKIVDESAEELGKKAAEAINEGASNGD